MTYRNKIMDIKCKHCRKQLIEDSSAQLLTAHCELKTNHIDTGCGTSDPEPCSYMSTDNMPGWIEQIIDQEAWTKGRLHCPRCNNRIGSFNFINEFKCGCGQCITPPIRIINSKVDILFPNR